LNITTILLYGIKTCYNEVNVVLAEAKGHPESGPLNTRAWAPM